MAERTNPFSLKVDLNAETNTVDVVVREKDEKGNFEEIDTRSFPLTSIAAELMPMVTLYGYSKLLQDRSSSTAAGPEKLAAMVDVEAQFAEGKWERDRVAGAPVVSAEVEALAAIKNCSVADVQKSLRRYTKEVKEKILANEAVKAKAEEIRAARSTDDNAIDLESLAV